MEVYFSVIDNCSDAIVREIERAKSSVEFAIYIITDKKICEALINAKKRGLLVRGVSEKKNEGPLSKQLVNKKILKLRGGNGLMHHKFMIIDRRLLLTGSYNYTYSADNKNDENFLMIRDNYVISRYLQELLRLWE